MKKVVVISTSLRPGSNSHLLAEQFAEGQADRKQAYKDAHWEEDLAKAREAGKRMAEKILG